MLLILDMVNEWTHTLVFASDWSFHEPACSGFSEIAACHSTVFLTLTSSVLCGDSTCGSPIYHDEWTCVIKRLIFKCYLLETFQPMYYVFTYPVGQSEDSALFDQYPAKVGMGNFIPGFFATSPERVEWSVVTVLS